MKKPVYRCITLVPKPYRGVEINGRDVAAKTRVVIGEIKPSSSYIALAVWEDSFEAFQQVKTALVSKGFEYRIIPVRTIQILMGHSSIKSTLRYLHNTQKHLTTTQSPLDLLRLPRPDDVQQ